MHKTAESGIGGTDSRTRGSESGTGWIDVRTGGSGIGAGGPDSVAPLCYTALDNSASSSLGSYWHPFLTLLLALNKTTHTIWQLLA